MDVTGSEWPKWGRNVPSELDTYLMYLFEAQEFSNSCRILEGWYNMYVTLHMNI